MRLLVMLIMKNHGGMVMNDLKLAG